MCAAGEVMHVGGVVCVGADACCCVCIMCVCASERVTCTCIGVCV